MNSRTCLLPQLRADLKTSPVVHPETTPIPNSTHVAYRGSKQKAPQWHQIRGDYRQHLFEKGLELLEDPESGVKGH